MSRYLYPRAGDAPQSILLGASRRGLGFAVGCGLVFCVAFSCFARAVVSFVPLTSSRSALVLCVRPWSRAGVSFFPPLAPLCPMWRWFRVSLILGRFGGGVDRPARRWFSRPRLRWFRVSLILDRVWCWFWSSRVALVLVFRVFPWFWSCAVVAFYFSLCSAPGVGRPRQQSNEFVL